MVAVYSDFLVLASCYVFEIVFGDAFAEPDYVRIYDWGFFSNTVLPVCGEVLVFLLFVFSFWL